MLPPSARGLWLNLVCWVIICLEQQGLRRIKYSTVFYPPLYDNPGLQIKLQLISCSQNQEVGILWRGRRCQLAVSVDRTGSQPHRSEEQYTAGTHTAALLSSVHANMCAHCFWTMRRTYFEQVFGEILATVQSFQIANKLCA